MGTPADVEGIADGSPPRYLGVVRRTALINMAASLVAAGTGVLLARWLGPAGRGEYAAATSYFGLSLVIFELGLASSTVYFVSRTRERADDYVRTNVALFIPLSVVAGAVAVVLALTTMHTAQSRLAFLILPACIVISFVGAPPTFALQSLDIGRWNLVRIIQPVVFVAFVIIAFILVPAKVSTVLIALTVSLLVQALLARAFYNRARPARGRFAPDTVRPMLRFGLLNMSSTAPNSINGRFDQLLLAFLVPAAALGQYAVAVTLSLVAGPLATAFGYVAFPRLATGADPSTTIRHATRGAMVVALGTEAAIVLVAPFVVAPVFGTGYGKVTMLLFILAPGAVLFTVNQVLGDVLRGLGRPGLVARCEWTGVIGTLGGLAVTVPAFGTYGAAATSTVVYTLVHLMLRHAVRMGVLPATTRAAPRHALARHTPRPTAQPTERPLPQRAGPTGRPRPD